jgi:Xaa-Pro aminopeptidase
MYTNPHRAQIIEKARRIFAKSPIDIRSNFATLRSVKEPEEIAIISSAIDITHAGLNLVLKDISKYSNEQSIEAELTKQFQMLGASGHAYKPIIAGGVASCTLHYVANNAQLKKGDVLLFDVGAEFNNYAADISRTIVYGTEPSNQQKEIISATKEAQSEIITYLRPGITWKQLADCADQIIAKKLIRLGLIAKIHQKNDIRKYFPHAVSHFLGIDVHDVGDYTQPLTAGMVITIEPGIYIKNESIGVRFEDDVVITKNGAQILGSSDISLV